VHVHSINIGCEQGQSQGLALLCCTPSVTLMLPGSPHNHGVTHGMRALFHRWAWQLIEVSVIMIIPYNTGTVLIILNAAACYSMLASPAAS